MTSLPRKPGGRARVVVLISGVGTNLQAILDAQADPDFPAEVVAVGSDRHGAPGLERGSRAGAATFVMPPGGFADRDSWDRALADEIRVHEPEWVVSAGFMRMLGPEVLRAFPDRIINTHPALLPAFPGPRAVPDALAYGVKLTGVTVHLIDSGMDTGPVIAQRAIELRDDDDETALHERIKVIERALLVEVVRVVAAGGLEVSGRKVRIVDAG